MSLKNIMPKKKMQTGGGTFLGPFATQAGQATPRQQFTPGFVPTRTGDTSPTINLPGQDPIDTGSGATIQPISQDKVRRLDAKRQTEQAQADIDPTIAGGPIDIDAAIAGGAKAGMSRDQVLSSSPAFQQTLVGYDPNDPRFTEFLGEDGIFQTFMKGLVGPKAGLGIGLAALTGGAPLAAGAIASAGIKSVRSASKEGTLNVPTAPSFTQPSGVLPPMSSAGGAPSGIPTPITQTGALPTSPGGQFGAFTTPTTDPFAADRAQTRTTVAATNAGIVGSELFSGDPTYAGGAKEGKDGLYATGGSGAFTSMAHYSSGVSQLDESNIVAEGINSGSFTNAQEGRSFISNAVESGFTQAEVETLAKNPTVTTNISMSQAPTPEAPDAPKVICAELYRQGLLEKEIFELDEEFGRHLRKVDPDIINGYHQWALPLVSLMQRSIVASHIIKIIAKPVVKHIAYQMGYPSKTYLGAAMFIVGKHICKFIAKKDVAHA
jgi:hypothetical protein|tara:strand:+ start:57 stop:1532 length:1476 start_codon:yes stop_codon:yes gene_type:complete